MSCSRKVSRRKGRARSRQVRIPGSSEALRAKRAWERAMERRFRSFKGMETPRAMLAGSTRLERKRMTPGESSSEERM